MSWVTLSSKTKPRRSRIKMNAAVKKRKKKKAPSPARKTGGQSRSGRIFLALAAPAALGIGLYWFLSTSSFFQVKEIEVVNNHDYLPGEVIELSGLRPGGNIFQLDAESCRKRLLENVNFRDVRIQRIFPGTVRVSVEEREPRARIKFGQLYTIDEQGVILKGRKEDYPGSLPVVRGLRVKGDVLTPESDREACLQLLREIDKHDIGTMLRISDISLSASDEIVIRTDDGPTITLKKNGYGVQMGRLKVVLEELGGEISRTSKVDLRYSQIPVSFRD